MKRRQLLVGLTLLAASGAAGVLVFRRLSPIRWTKAPTVTVISAPDDPRIALVRAAVDFWNGTFADLGSSFRLGAVTTVTASVPDVDLQALSSRAMSPLPHTLPAAVSQLPGDLFVALSGADFLSFTVRDGDRVMIAIKNGRAPLLVRPNVLQNVIAHELGHAIGLGHNGDPELLMCGRPAPCRPDAYESASERFFPLSAAEKTQLLRLYPAGWRSTG